MVSAGIALVSFSFFLEPQVEQPRIPHDLDKMASTADSSKAFTSQKMSRWIDLKALSFSMRYRNASDSDGYQLYNYGQQRGLVDGRFKLDEEGKY